MIDFGSGEQEIETGSLEHTGEGEVDRRRSLDRET